LGGPNEAPTPPSGNPLRHDYLVVDGEVYSFQKGDNLFWSQGHLEKDEKTDNEDCAIISRDPVYDEAALQAIDETGEPHYTVSAFVGQLAWFAGARNCQTWADDVINRADEIYSNMNKIQGGW